MTRLAVLLLLGTGYLLVGVVPGVAKKKPSKPIIETFEATTVPAGEVLRFEIEEFSTDQDVQELAKAYSKGGKDAVVSALGKIEKGRSLVRLEAYPIRLVQSASQGGTRTVFIIADATDRVAGDLGGQVVFIGHHGYPFTFVQLRMDQQGKGIGQQVPFAAITFNKQGVIDIKSVPVRSGAAIRLANVHAVSQ
jgi:hypothetical protein